MEQRKAAKKKAGFSNNRQTSDNEEGRKELRIALRYAIKQAQRRDIPQKNNCHDLEDILQDVLVDVLQGKQTVGATTRAVSRYYRQTYTGNGNQKQLLSEGFCRFVRAGGWVACVNQMGEIVGRERESRGRGCNPEPWEILSAKEDGYCPRCYSRLDIQDIPFDDEGIGGTCCYCVCGFSFVSEMFNPPLRCVVGCSPPAAHYWKHFHLIDNLVCVLCSD